MKKIFSVLLLIPFLFSCETNPPVVPTLDKSYGKIFVNSNVPGAEIFVDDVFTNSFTPDTITVTAGQHSVKLKKEGYADVSENVEVKENSLLSLFVKMLPANIGKTVFIEDFSNVSCPPCVESNKILESLVNEYGSAKLVKVKYATNFPSPNDPFYLAASQYSDARISFYSVFSAPQIIVDGTAKPIATDSTDIKNAVEKELNRNALFSLNVKDSVSADSFYVNVTLGSLNIDTMDVENINLFVVVVEKEIDFTTSPGSNGETKFFDVARKILPDKNGMPISKFESFATKKFDFKTGISNEWKSNKIISVVFLQNISTREVLQSAKGE